MWISPHRPLLTHACVHADQARDLRRLAAARFRARQAAPFAPFAHFFVRRLVVDFFAFFFARLAGTHAQDFAMASLLSALARH